MADNSRRDAQVEKLRRYADLIARESGKAVRPYRADGFVNLMTKYGTSKDPSEQYKYVPELQVPDSLLTLFYEGNGLFAKIIDAPAEEAVKHGFTLEDVSDQTLIDFYQEALEELDFEETAMTAIKWARLYGGSIAVMLINDGRGLEEPLDWSNIRSIDDIRVYDRSVIQPDYDSMFSYDPRDPFRTRGSRLGMPERYQVFSKYGTFTVHDSRCLVFRNGVLPEGASNSVYQFWGQPEYVRINKAIRDGLKAFWEKHGESIKAALAAAWEAIKTILLTVWNVIKTVATTIFEGLRNFWAKHGEQIKTAFTNIWNGIKNVVTTVWNIIKVLAETIFNALKAFWDTWGSTIITVFTGIWEVIKAVFGTVFNVLADLFAAFSALFAGDWEGFWSNIGAFFSDLWNGLVNIISTVLNAIWSVISSVFSVISDFIGGIVSTIWDTIVNAFTSVRDSVAEIFNSIKETVSSVFESLVGIVKAPVNAIINLINGLIDGLNGLSFDIPDWIPGIGGKTFGFNIPHIPALAEGGYLKPNNPQLAIVGDNRTQGEIVAPEGKLLTIMKQALEAFAVNGKIRSGDESQGGNGMTVVLQALNALVAKMMPTPATGAMNAVTQNRSIVQNNVFNNEFNGDTPVQKKASKAMDKSSKDATSEMARALAFSR